MLHLCNLKTLKSILNFPKPVAQSSLPKKPCSIYKPHIPTQQHNPWFQILACLQRLLFLHTNTTFAPTLIEHYFPKKVDSNLCIDISFKSKFFYFLFLQLLVVLPFVLPVSKLQFQNFDRAYAVANAEQVRCSNGSDHSVLVLTQDDFDGVGIQVFEF